MNALIGLMLMAPDVQCVHRRMRANVSGGGASVRILDVGSGVHFCGIDLQGRLKGRSGSSLQVKAGLVVGFFF